MHSHRSFTMFEDWWGRIKCRRRESALIDSSQNRRSATDDEPQRRFPRKIFLLPKSRFGVLATRPQAAFECSRHRSQRDRRYFEFRKVLQYKRFLHPCKEIADRARGSSHQRARVSASHRSSRAARGVNTSLSGKLFFLARWCIRDGVHLDSRVHAAIKPSHIGGQHGQESEEGEERSEESCEEDPQGLQEEVSLALTKMPAV